MRQLICSSGCASIGIRRSVLVSAAMYSEEEGDADCARAFTSSASRARTTFRSGFAPVCSESTRVSSSVVIKPLFRALIFNVLQKNHEEKCDLVHTFENRE